MTEFYRVHRAFKTGLLASVASLAFATPVAAQDEGDGAERIVVTGSRIERTSNYTAPTPVNVFTEAQIELSGAVNTSELIRTLPAAGVSALTSTNSNFLVGASGINTVDLRNLGGNRTLVLVNGRRFVAGVPGSTLVDFNSIPTEFIERIDVLTGAASSIYGSDALAGVVNVILRDDLEGVISSAQYGASEQGDDETIRASVTYGANFAQGRGRALASVTWSDEGGVFARDRESIERDGASLAFFTGDPADAFEELQPFYSSFSERGNISIPGAPSNLVFDETTGTVRPFTSANPDGSALDGFNRQAFRAIAVPTERFLFSSAVDYEISPRFNLFFEGTYASTETQSELEPFPLSSSNIYGQNLQQFIDDDGDGTPDRSAFGIPILNPFVPAGIRDAARLGADFDGDGVQDIADEDLVVGFSRRTTELDQRGANNIRQTARFVLGLEGDLTENWRYETSLNFGRTTQAQQSTGQINVVNFRYALDAIPDPVNPGQFICADEIARLEGCVPINIFGAGSISPEAAAYVRAPANTDATVEQAVVNAYLAGDTPFRIPFAADPVSVAFGVEYRTERSESIPDALSQLGLNAGNITPVVRGDFSVGDAFAEASLPLVQDRPLFEDLTLNLSARWSDYTTVGNTFAWAVSGEWSPTDWVRLRSQYAVAVRAPNIGELFSPPGQTFPSVADPCEGLTTTGAGDPAFLNTLTDAASGVDGATVNSPTATACFADANVAARVARDGVFVLTQAERQGVSGFNGGNPDLFEEEGTTFTIGAVFRPNTGNAFIDNFAISLDYFDIEIEDAISTLGRQTSLDECYSSSTTPGVLDPASPFCANILRFTGGPQLGALEFINAFQQNLQTVNTAGVDVQASYNLALNDLFNGVSTSLGELAWSLAYTYTDTYELTGFEGATPQEFVGVIGTFENEVLLSTVYYNGPFTFSYDMNWLDEAVLSSTGFFSDSQVDSVAFHDIQARWDLFDTGVTLVGGVDNLSNEFVPIGGSAPGSVTGTGTNGAIYDAIGRRFYIGVRAQF